MKSFALKYSAFVGCLMLVFTNFVACGAQMYQVSLDEDVSRERVPQQASNPDSDQYGLHAPNGWTELPVRFRVGNRLTEAQQAGLMNAMKKWEIASGRELGELFDFEGVHRGTDGDSFKDLYSSLNDMVNGDYLDQDWGKTGKPTVVLATTIWDNDPYDRQAIDTADIRFNAENYRLGDSLSLTADGEREVVDMETLALHELGHLLGLSHVSETKDPNSIMTPSLYIGEGLANRRLSEGDVKRIQKIYGCGAAACDVQAIMDRLSRVRSSVDGAKLYN